MIRKFLVDILIFWWLNSAMISELISNMHDQIREKENKQKVFKDLFDHTLLASGDSVPAIEYKLPYPKEDFLRFLVSENGVLLHGSSNRDMEVLEPKQANDSAKMSGNKKAVYCVSDPVLPIFYAIKDRDKFQNVIVSSGVLNNLETGDEEYHFRIPKSLLEIKPWTRGFVYILDKNKYED